MAMSDYQKARDLLKAQAQDLINRLEAYEIPEEKMQAICDYAIGMKAKNPAMKNDRIVRKTAEHFKLVKAVEQEEENEKVEAPVITMHSR